MKELLLQPYELSIWEDVLVTSDSSADSTNTVNSYYKENKIAIIGSNNMTSEDRAMNPILTKKVNGEITLSFEMVHKYFDIETGDYVFNPWEKYLINERKVKLFYEDEWYDFIIKDKQESSEDDKFTYQLTSLFVNELSKVGYNIVLNADLGNNQGTIFELGEKVVKDTDWVIDREHSDIIQQLVSEPLYRYKVGSALNVFDINSNTEVTLPKDEIILVFYSAIANKQIKNVQFLRERDYTQESLDDEGVALLPNYRFLDDVTYNIEGLGFKVSSIDFTPDIPTGQQTPINLGYQGYRLAYNQRTTYDPIMDRAVSVYKINYEDGTEQLVYKYTDYEYVSSNVVTSYVTNGSGFNIYADGSLEGWSNATPTVVKYYDVPSGFSEQETVYAEDRTSIPTNVQGLGTDGEYLYLAIRDKSDDATSKTVIYRIDPANESLAAATADFPNKSEELVLGHANHIGYDSTTNELLIVDTFGSSTSDVPGYKANKNMMIRVDRDTLKIKENREFDLTPLIRSAISGAGRYVSAITYDEVTGQFLIATRWGFIFANKDFSGYTDVVSIPYETGFYIQSVFVDGNYIVTCCWDKTATTPKRTIVYYDREGNALTSFQMEQYGEMEGACKLNDKWYFSWSNVTTQLTSATALPIVSVPGPLVFQDMELVTYPSITTKSILDLQYLTGITGYLRLRFNGVLDGEYKNTYLNKGIGDHRNEIGTFSEGEKYIFRLAYGKSSTADGAPVNSHGEIKAIVAKYTTEAVKAASKSGEEITSQYVNKIDPKNILFKFDSNNPTLKNNEIRGGYFRVNETGDYVTYYKDGISVTPSTDYCYIGPVGEQGTTEDTKIWSASEGKYIDKTDTNFLDYYYYEAECLQSFSNTELSENGGDIGIFIYTDDNSLVFTDNNPVYIFVKEVQLFKKKTDGNQQPVLIGNLPKSTSLETDFYYLKPEINTAAEDIKTYSTPEALTSSLGGENTTLTPLYNEDYEKISSIEASQSNVFNIIQDLCEAFECWGKFNIKHDINGAIALDENNAPIKTITFHNYVGDDNFAGFKYGINLNSVDRTTNSDELVTKLIVEQVANDAVEGGTVSIARAPSNPTGESYIFNMNYYLNQGLIADRDAYQKDYNEYIEKLRKINSEYTTKSTELSLATNALSQAKAKLNVYSTTIKEAEESLTEASIQFAELTGFTYENYVAGNGNTITFTKGETELIAYFDTQVDRIKFSFFDASGEEIVLDHEEGNTSLTNKTEIIYMPAESETKTISDIYYVGVVDKITQFVFTNSLGSYSTLASDPSLASSDIVTQAIRQYWTFEDGGMTIDLIPSNENESLVKLVGTIYTYQNVIKEYDPLLRIAQEEVADLNLKVNGTDEYTFTVTTSSKESEPNVLIESTKETLNDYKPGLSFVLKNEFGSYEEQSTITQRFFTQDTLYDQITFLKYPENYRLKYNAGSVLTSEPVTITLNVNATKIFVLTPIEEKQGLKDELEDLIKQKDEINKNFYTKYSRFIQEGAWTSQDYVDNELYYLDALKVSNTSAMPQVTYDLQVSEVSKIEGFENYKFKIGDKTYLEDPEFFGYTLEEDRFEQGFEVDDSLVIQLPKKVTDVKSVSYTEDNLVKPAEYNYDFIKNQIIITQDNLIGQIVTIVYNYKVETPVKEEVVVSEITRHLDEPQSDTITIQNYKTQFETLFQRIAATVQTVEFNKNDYSRAAAMLNASGTIDTELLLKSLKSLDNGISLGENGLVSITDGGLIVKNVANSLYQMRISGDVLQASNDGGETWNNLLNSDGLLDKSIDTQEIIIKDGDNPSFRWDSYGLNAYGFGEDETYLKTYVRFDKYGMYGIKNAENYSPNDLDDIKNNAFFGVTWDGFFIKNSYTDGYVSISSDNDFQVVANDTERIKIGAISQASDGSYQYGIRINNDLGQSVFETKDDGNIEITGTINATGGMFKNEVTVGNPPNAIVLRGSDTEAVIGSSSYFDNTTTGWAIKSDGDAIFNNITARGAIKTAVFEYEEIQAVGGAFLFRPSTTIRQGEVTHAYVETTDTSAVDGKDYYTYDEIIEEYDLVYDTENMDFSENTYYEYVVQDLVLTVEQGILFQVGDWCKVSNYNNTSDSVVNNLNSAGLVNIFKISNVQGNKITLADAGSMFEPYFEDWLKVEEIDSSSPVVLTTNPLGYGYTYEVYITENGVTQKVLTQTADSVTLEETEEEVLSELTYIGNLNLVDNEFVDTGDHIAITYDGAHTTLYYDQTITTEFDILVKINYNNNKGTDELVGGSLINFGKDSNDPNYQNGIHNYGIGINSSDNYVALPARAISLFETEVHPNDSIKVSYNFRGILGTLPALGSEYMSPAMEHFMEGTQGIYTNNMYIGDASKYLAFYHYHELDENTGNLVEKTNLRVVADEFVLSADDSDLGELIQKSVHETVIEYCLSASTITNTHGTAWLSLMPSPTQNNPYLWQRTKIVYNDGSIKYIPDDGGIGDGFYVETAEGGGAPGEDALSLKINSSNGDFFRNNNDTSILSVVIFKGPVEITSQSQLDSIYGQGKTSLKWVWKNYNDNDFVDVPSELLSNDGFTFNINGNMIFYGKVFQCELIYNEEE